MARATPTAIRLDGLPSGHAVTAAIYKTLPYQPIDDFTFIGQAIEFPFVIVTYPDHTIRSMPDLISDREGAQEPLLCGVPGAGTPQHLLTDIFHAACRHQIQVVPFRGGNQALTELLGKRLDFLIDPPIALIGQIKAGGLHAIGVTSEKRYAPTAGRRHHRRERASRDFPSPRGWAWSARPSCRRDRGAAQHEINALIAEPAVVERIHALGKRPKGGTPERFKCARRYGHRALDQGDRRRRHRAHLAGICGCVYLRVHVCATR